MKLPSHVHEEHSAIFKANHQLYHKGRSSSIPQSDGFIQRGYCLEGMNEGTGAEHVGVGGMCCDAGDGVVMTCQS